MVKVGVVLPIYDVDIKESLNFGVQAEELGYDSLWVEDHLMPWQLSCEKPTLEGWVLLSVLAVKTEKIRLGTMVSNILYRHPAVLAKLAVMVDRVSNGRFTMGLGLGWYEDEAKAYGLPMPPLRTRIEMFEEAIKLMKTLWTSKGRVSFKGKYFSLENAPFEPKSIQKPHPPIIVGTGGEKVMLKIVAREANGWNYGALGPEEVKRKLDILRKYCSEVGRNFKEIEKTFELYVFIGKTRDEAEAILKEYLEIIPKGDKLQHLIQQLYIENALKGTLDDILEQMRKYVNAGIEHFILVFPGKKRFEMMNYFGKYVLEEAKKL